MLNAAKNTNVLFFLPAHCLLLFNLITTIKIGFKNLVDRRIFIVN